MHHQIQLVLALRSTLYLELGLSFVKTLATLELFTQQNHFYKT